jgi:uncharacterized protein (TIGR00725 family)
MALPTRLPIVGLLGSGSEPHEDRAAPLGCWLATQSVHLLTGAGQGVMAAVSRAFAQMAGRKGLVLGILPCLDEDRPEVPKTGYPNDWVEVPIRTHLHLSGTQGTELGSRNHIVVLTANVLVALPGGPGTASELQLAVRYKKPVIAFLKTREEIFGLPSEVRSEANFDQVKAFIREQLASGQ